MAKKREVFAATFAGVVITGLDSVLLDGPFLGLRGLLLSFFLSILAWFTGTAMVHRMSIHIDARTKEYRKRFWDIVLVMSVVVSGVILLYISSFEVGKAEYSRCEITFHLFLIFIFAMLIRTTIYATLLAFRSRR